MAIIIRFPASPRNQWKIRQRIEQLKTLMGWDMARCLAYSYKNPEEAWPLLDDRELGIILEYVEAEYLTFQSEQDEAASAKLAQDNAKPKRPARVYAFPMTPEIEARQKVASAVKAAKPKKARAAKTGKPAVQPDDKEQAAKANYIRRVKMLQRDCEMALPRFDDGTYRAILAARFNADTSTALSIPQLRALLLHMKGLLRKSPVPVKASFDAPALLYHDATGLNRCGSMRKIQALLAEKGKAEGKYIRWSYALGILKRQTKGVVADWENATPRQLDAVIAALSRDAGRKGRRTV